MLNRGHEYREICDGRTCGRTLLDYLASTYTHSTAADWRERIRLGAVRLDGQRADPATPLVPGQVLTWQRPPWREPDVPLDFEIVYCDPSIVAVSKPAGLPTVPGAGFLEHTLLHRVRSRFDGAVPMHRLGRHTSGLVVFARDASSRSRLAEAWRTGAVRKEYRALASGAPTDDAFEIDAPIGPVPYAPLGTLFAARADGRPSLTRVRVLERRSGAFLAAVELVTGRPHQIRIHLAAVGHPLVGDPLYADGGRPRAGCTALPGDPGYRLHAMGLELPEPDRLILKAPPPAELASTGEGR